MPDDAWKQVELTEQELQYAIDGAKILKWEREKKRRIDEYREQVKAQIQAPWQAQQMYEYLLSTRMMRCGWSVNGGADGKPVYKFDHRNNELVRILCYYFAKDARFENLGIRNADGSVTKYNYRLNKGLLLCGNVGTGKTTLMRLFAINKHCSYDVMNAMSIARDYTRNPNVIDIFSKWHKYEPKDIVNLYSEKFGLCIDDVGTEDEKSYFGNKSNVIAEIIFERYANQLPHSATHITTNLDGKSIKDFYGPRVWSRFIEMFNVIEIKCEDRRYEQ